MTSSRTGGTAALLPFSLKYWLSNHHVLNLTTQEFSRTIKQSLPLISCVFMWSLLSIDLETEIASDNNVFHCCQHLLILVKVFFFLCVNVFFIGTILFWPTKNYLYLIVSCLKILSLIGLRYCSKSSLCVYLCLQQISYLHLVTEESKAERG